jgi:FLVCR family feline leukemia virus subgroup C receptor-related protein
MQWLQYSMIKDIVIPYYGVDNIAVDWTSMIYMITYVPLVFPASWFLDKMVT